MSNWNLASTARPVTDATITVRIIKSFRYRTEKSLVLHHIDLTTTTVGGLKEIARNGALLIRATNHNLFMPGLAISVQPGWKPYRNVALGDSTPFPFVSLTCQ